MLSVRLPHPCFKEQQVLKSPRHGRWGGCWTMMQPHSLLQWHHLADLNTSPCVYLYSPYADSSHLQTTFCSDVQSRAHRVSSQDKSFNASQCLTKCPKTNFQFINEKLFSFIVREISWSFFSFPKRLFKCTITSEKQNYILHKWGISLFFIYIWNSCFVNYFTFVFQSSTWFLGRHIFTINSQSVWG